MSSEADKRQRGTLRDVIRGEGPGGPSDEAIARPYLKNVAMIAETSAETVCGG